MANSNSNSNRNPNIKGASPRPDTTFYDDDGDGDRDRPDMETLRVAQTEIRSGDTRGKVYVRISPGSVAFLQDRPQVDAKLSQQIRQAVLEDSSSSSFPQGGR